MIKVDKLYFFDNTRMLLWNDEIIEFTIKRALDQSTDGPETIFI